MNNKLGRCNCLIHLKWKTKPVGPSHAIERKLASSFHKHSSGVQLAGCSTCKGLQHLLFQSILTKIGNNKKVSDRLFDFFSDHAVIV